jgi:hypothetical protein
MTRIPFRSARTMHFVAGRSHQHASRGRRRWLDRPLSRTERTILMAWTACLLLLVCALLGSVMRAGLTTSTPGFAHKSADATTQASNDPHLARHCLVYGKYCVSRLLGGR